MKKHILLTALAAVALAGSAQETMYLIKGDKVVAKYSVSDIDYAAFELPAGVEDLPGGSSVLNKTYLSASPVYLGTDADCGHFQIQLSSRLITEEQPPLNMLYLQISTPKITDLSNIQVPDGTYTLGDAEAIAPFKFYPGKRVSEGGADMAAGTVVVDKPDNTTLNYNLVTDGQFTVKHEDAQYTISGMLKLESGDVLEFSYSGPMIVINESEEQLPADELPLPASVLTEDVAFTPLASECYASVWPNFFQDEPQLDYFNIYLYDSGNYDNNLQLGLLVDREKNPDVLLPAGKYPIVNRFDGSLSTTNLGTCPAFSIKTDTNPCVDYGCWLITNYSEKSPLVAGEVEVLEDATSLDNVKLKVTLTDNATPAHTVTCTFEGKLYNLD